MGNLRRNARDLGTLAIGLTVVVFFWTFPACFEKKQPPRNDLPSMEQDNSPAPSTGRKPTTRF